jgi:nucleotide-binding universal stress UspA family protein
MQILVAYDGSPLSEAAIDALIDRPWPTGSAAHIVMAAEPPYTFPMPPDLEVEVVSLKDVREQIRKRAEDLVARAVARVRAAGGVAVTGEVREGRAKQALLEAIRDRRPDLVIAGSHGYSPAERLLLGSVSHALVTHAPCDVEVVKIARRR